MIKSKSLKKLHGKVGKSTDFELLRMRMRVKVLSHLDFSGLLSSVTGSTLAPFATIFDVLPVSFPLFAPSKWALAHGTNFAR